MKLFNTLSRKLEDFTPIKEGEVKLYTCGPTVYNYVHIGNLRAFLLSDLVRRAFEYNGYKVEQVMNITDFGHLVGDADDTDDKMTIALKREGKDLTMENMYALASEYAQAFKEDMRSLNILTPAQLPRASEHVPGMIAYVKKLLDKDIAYKTSDGIYFDVSKYPEYGSLGGSASTDHSRTGINSEKRDPRDFAVWKFNAELGWDAPWGKGFPGWHIECTAMSTEYLGNTFDIHTGGVDLGPVHHNNEIAQAEAANHTEFVHYWLHNEFVHVDGTKMSKSLSNDFGLRQIIEKRIDPLAYRYWLLTGHYRQSINFTWEALDAAATALERARRKVSEAPAGGSVNAEYEQKFKECIENDLDTPAAVALLWQLLKDEKVLPADMRATAEKFDIVLGVDLARNTALPPEVLALLEARMVARAMGNFTLSDELRGKIEALGFTVRDTPDGQRAEPR